MTSSRCHNFSSDLLPSFVCPWTESKSEKKFLVPVEKKIEKTEERSKSALPAPEEILLVRQRSSFFNDDQNGVNWNNDSLVSRLRFHLRVQAFYFSWGRRQDRLRQILLMRGKRGKLNWFQKIQKLMILIRFISKMDKKRLQWKEKWNDQIMFKIWPWDGVNNMGKKGQHFGTILKDFLGTISAT